MQKEKTRITPPPYFVIGAILPAAAALSLLSGCGGVSQEKYDAQVKQYDTLQMMYEGSLENFNHVANELSAVTVERDALKAELEDVERQLDEANTKLAATNNAVANTSAASGASTTLSGCAQAVRAAYTAIFQDNVYIQENDADLTACVWMDGLATVSALARTDAAKKEIWSTFAGACAEAAQLQREMMDKRGVTKKAVLYVMNDLNKKTALMTFEDGVKTYDCMEE